MKRVHYLIILISGMIVFSCNSFDPAVPVDGVTVDPDEISLATGDSFQLEAHVSPEDAADQNVTWSSSDASIVSVNNGFIEAVSPGTATITATTIDGGYSATCEVIVSALAVDVAEIIIGNTELTMNVGDTEQLDITVLPVDATNPGVSWSSTDESIVIVDQNGELTGVSEGEATVTVSSENGVTATCIVTVEAHGTLSMILTESEGLKTSAYGSGGENGIEITTDGDGVPYIAFYAYDVSLVENERAWVQVWKYSGNDTQWNQFGPNIAKTNSGGSITSQAPGMAIDNSGEVYVSYLYYDNVDDELFGSTLVAHSSGSDWELLGSKMQSGTNVMNGAGELCFKEDGTLLIAHTDDYDSYVNYWTGTEWSSYNGYRPNPSDMSIYGSEIVCHGNIPYVCIRKDVGMMGVLKGKPENGLRGEGNQWEWLGNSLITDDAYNISAKTNEAPLAISSDGIIYSAYKQYVSSEMEHMAFVKRFNGSNWERVGAALVANNSNPVDIVISSDIVYLCIGEYDGGIKIYKLNEAGQWVYEGTTSKIGVYYNFDLAAGKNGDFFIAFECTSDPDKGEIGVFHYTPSFYN
ncbi:MAG: Ig domain-containing protein [Prolixibacteraceae bacterium]|nr:Ig domain-containing protein [Prolixibacteraceae bacterium]